MSVWGRDPALSEVDRLQARIHELEAQLTDARNSADDYFRALEMRTERVRELEETQRKFGKLQNELLDRIHDMVEAGDNLLARMERHQVHEIYREDVVAVEAWAKAKEGL